MNKTIKLFIGGLPPTLTKTELEEVFREFKPGIRIDLKIDCKTNMHKGFAFILLKDPAVANRIVGRQFRIRNRNIQVQFSKKVPKSQNVAPLRLFCRGIPKGITDAELTTFFDRISPCRAAYAIKDMTGRHRGFGFIELCTEQGAQILLSLRKFKLKEANLVVEEYNKPFRYRQPPFHWQTTSISFLDNSKIGSIFQSGKKSSGISAGCVLGGRLSGVHTIKDSVSASNTSRTQVWKKNSTKPLYKAIAAEMELSSPYCHSGEHDLFKIGPQNWIFRNHHKELTNKACVLKHDGTNMRFNLLSRSSALNYSPR